MLCCKMNAMKADKSHKLHYAVSLSPKAASEWSQTEGKKRNFVIRTLALTITAMDTRLELRQLIMDIHMDM